MTVLKSYRTEVKPTTNVKIKDNCSKIKDDCSKIKDN